MHLPDVNVLVALIHPGHVHHRTVREWFASTERFVTTPVTESGLVRLALNPVVTGLAVGAADVLASLRSLRGHPRARFLPDDASLADPSIVLDGLVGSRQVTDLHLVNLAARHEARLVTLDTKLAPTLVPSDRARVLTLR